MKFEKCNKCNRLIGLNNFNKHHTVCKGIVKKINHINENWKNKNNKYNCPYCGKEYNKNGISTHIWLNHTDDGKSHKNKLKNNIINNGGNTGGGWNKGLTKETDERVKSMSDKLKNGAAAKFYGKNNPATKKKVREILSEKRSKYLEEVGNGGYKNIKWYKIKNIKGEEFIVRGSWEKITAEWLNKNNILWIRKVYLKYNNGEYNKTYTPDFYLPNYDTHIEVKGYFSKKDKEKLGLVKEQNNIKLIMLFNKDIQKIKNALVSPRAYIQ